MQRKAKNSAYMKFVNKQAVLNAIRIKPVYRAELSEILGLTRAAITMIVDELIKDNIVIETDIVNTAFGKKPILLDLNPTRYYSIGVDISRLNCNIGLVNIKGEVIIQKNVDISVYKNSYEVIGIITDEIKQIIDIVNINPNKILGIGVTSPGPLDIFSGTILNPPNFDIWHNINIVQELEEKTKYKVILENIANARAIAEKHYGRAIDLDSFILIVVDEGVGGGIILENKLYRGVGGFGNEFGHTSIKYDGNCCSCGNTGCIETYAAIPNILKEMNKGMNGLSSWNKVVDKAEEGDKLCIKTIEKEALYISFGIINILNVLELQAVILAGDINYKPEKLIKKIKNNISKALITRDIHEVQIYNTSITENSRVISAASIIIEDYFSI